MIFDTLDRYLLREWLKIFVGTVVGFPLFVILVMLTDDLDIYLVRGLTPKTIAIAHVFGIPDLLFQILPAAVLFATVFSLGAMCRHSELVATKASGRSLTRIVLPVFAIAVLASGLGLVIGEVAPTATRRQLELLGEMETVSLNNRRNFVYRAEEGWVYAVRDLNIQQRRLRDILLEREGAGEDYPTLAIQARRGLYDEDSGEWTLHVGRFRIAAGMPADISLQFDSLRTRNLIETPAELLAEPKKPEQMRYAELGRYVEALERSGGDGRALRVGRALKIAVPFTCIIIAIFAVPLVATAPKAGGAFGVAVSLGTTVVFLTLVQLSRGLGSSGVVPPTLAAWLPNMLFGVLGVWLLARAPT